MTNETILICPDCGQVPDERHENSGLNCPSCPDLHVENEHERGTI